MSIRWTVRRKCDPTDDAQKSRNTKERASTAAGRTTGRDPLHAKTEALGITCHVEIVCPVSKIHDLAHRGRLEPGWGPSEPHRHFAGLKQYQFSGPCQHLLHRSRRWLSCPIAWRRHLLGRKRAVRRRRGHWFHPHHRLRERRRVCRRVSRLLYPSVQCPTPPS